MKDMGMVQGSAEQAKELVVGKDTVYVHSDITKIETDGEGKSVENLYQYHEIQYTKDEYITMMGEKTKVLESSIIDTQFALCEVYENIGGKT